MTTAVEDFVTVIADLLIANWDNTNTSIASDPSIHTGNLDYSGANHQVAVADPSTQYIGETGFQFVDPSGGGPIKDANDRLMVHCGAYREDGEPNPKKLVWEFRREVERIVHADVLTPTGYDFISVTSAQRRPEPFQSPTWYVYMVRLLGRRLDNP